MRPDGVVVPTTTVERVTPMAKSTDMTGDAAGLAALAICESLLIALGDLEIMSRKDIGDILTDAAAAHRDAGASPLDSGPLDSGLHLAVAAIIDRIIAGRNGIPRL